MQKQNNISIDFNKNKIHEDKPHIKKNKLYNLMVVCMKCHDMIDRNEITINGWVETSKGIELDYIRNKKKSKKEKKYGNDTIDIIKKIQDKCKSTKEAKLFIKSTHNIKISRSTIRKIWKNEYI